MISICRICTPHFADVRIADGATRTGRAAFGIRPAHTHRVAR